MKKTTKNTKTNLESIDGKKNKLFKAITFLSVLTVSGFFSCSINNSNTTSETPSVPEKNTSENYILPLIETTDVHGYIVNTSGETIHYKLAYIADKVKDIRGRSDSYQKEKLLLLDAGDLYQGASVSNFQRGKPIYIAYDKMDYDAVCLGNHEFDWGVENMIDSDGTLLSYELDGKIFSNEVPVLCANLYQNDEKVSFTKDYVIVEKNAYNSDGQVLTVKIALIGFAENWSTSIIATQFKEKGYYIEENYKIAEKIASELESSGQCDATILIVHGVAETAAKKLGQESVIDLVLGGHSHQNESGKDKNCPPYLQCAAYGNYYSYAELNFTSDKNKKIKFDSISKKATIKIDENKDTHKSDNENLNDLDEEILKISEDAVNYVKPYLEEVIGYIETGANKYYISGSGDKASTMGNWMCDIIRRIGKQKNGEKADIAFVNEGGIRTYFPLAKNESQRAITVSNVYEIFPFDNRIFVYEITYEELLQVFNYALSSSGKSIASFVSGIDCYYTREERTSSSGSNYTVDVLKCLKMDGNTIYDGEWKDDWKNKKVTVAVCEYIATTDRHYYSSDPYNPFVKWNESEKLIEDNLIDNENAVQILKEEAEANSGKLFIDTKAHFIIDN